MLCPPIAASLQQTAVAQGATSTCLALTTNGVTDGMATATTNKSLGPQVATSKAATKSSGNLNGFKSALMAVNPTIDIHMNTISSKSSHNNNQARQPNLEANGTMVRASEIGRGSSENSVASGSESRRTEAAISDDAANENITTIKEIKSRSIGSLSPLFQSSAINLTQQHPALTGAGQQSGTNCAPQTLSSYNLIERRQAISMERLNSINPSTTNLHTNRPTSRYLSQIHQLSMNHHLTNSHSSFISHFKDNNSGSLSSGSNSSIDESASDAEQQQTTHHFDDPHHLSDDHHQNSHRLPQRRQQLVASATSRAESCPKGLSRSSSRVSRFRSAKEFFERLSSVSNSICSSNTVGSSHLLQNHPRLSGHMNTHYSNDTITQRPPIPFRPIKRSPERQRTPLQHSQQQLVQRGNVASRYTEPLGAGLSQPGGSAAAAKQAHNLIDPPTPAISPQSKSIKWQQRHPQQQPQNQQQKQPLLQQKQQPVIKSDEIHTVTSAAAQTDNGIDSAATSREQPSSICGDSETPDPNLKLASCAGTIATAIAGTPTLKSQQLREQPRDVAPPPRPSTLSIPFSSSLPSSCVYVKLKTTDHSGLSTNTILHINNSHLNNRNDDQNKSELNGCNSQDLAVLAFHGDNVIVGSGSLLVKRNKQLRIKFDENSAATFEYPSEEVMMREFGSYNTTPDNQEVGLTSDTGTSAQSPGSMQSKGGNQLPNQRLMWRQSFGLILSDGGVCVGGHPNVVESSTNSEPPIANFEKQKDDHWKGEW